MTVRGRYRVKEAARFLKETTGSLMIIHHSDADGSTATAQLLKYFRSRGVNPTSKAGSNDKKFFERSSKEKVDTLIFCDFQVDQYPDVIGSFKDKRVIIIDHHPISLDLNRQGIVHVNPRFSNPELYKCASHVVREILDLMKFDSGKWLANIGIVGDHEAEGSPDERIAADMIAAVKAVKHEPGIDAVTQFLSRSERIEDFIYNEKYQKIKKQVDRELDKQFDKAVKQGISDITWFEVKSRYSLGSDISGMLCDRFPKKTIITYSKDGKFYKISGRSKTPKIGDAFRVAAKAAGGRGGGHPVAAGAMIPAVNFNKFKEKVEEILK